MKFGEIIGPDNPIIAAIAELYCSSLTNIPVTVNRQGYDEVMGLFGWLW